MKIFVRLNIESDEKSLNIEMLNHFFSASSCPKEEKARFPPALSGEERGLVSRMEPKKKETFVIGIERSGFGIPQECTLTLQPWYFLGNEVV